MSGKIFKIKMLSWTKSKGMDACLGSHATAPRFHSLWLNSFHGPLQTRTSSTFVLLLIQQFGKGNLTVLNTSIFLVFGCISFGFTSNCLNSCLTAVSEAFSKFPMPYVLLLLYNHRFQKDPVVISWNQRIFFSLMYSHRPVTLCPITSLPITMVTQSEPFAKTWSLMATI